MLLQNRKKRSTYIIVTIVVLVMEILIERFLNDPFIRPYLGDALVVVLIYAFVMSISWVKPVTAMIVTLLFSYLVEFSQYLRLIEHLNLENNTFFKAVLGTSFSWIDMLMYTLGILAVYLWEKWT
jgi:hypothetical protein